jgi:hypothetical protein
MINFIGSHMTGGFAVYGVGLQPLDYWDRGFESESYQVCVVNRP